MTTDSEIMQSDWDERAEEDALHFIETTYDTSNIDYFFKVGEQKAEKTIDLVLEDWERYPLKKGTALDIGCGVGRMTRALADRFDHVIGIDVSSEMIKRARSLNENYENIDFYVSNGEEYTNIEDNSIDFVYSYEVFQHFPNKKVIESNIREISRVMKPSGRTDIHFRPYTNQGYIDLFGYIPFPRIFIQKIPKSAKKLYFYLLNGDENAGLKVSTTWTGTSITPSEFWRYCDEADLEVHQFRPDPTHSLGDRFFCIAEK